MSLKQIDQKNRIEFLKAFSTELMINSIKSELIERKIREQVALEKLRIKFFKTQKPVEEKFIEAQNSQIFTEAIYQNKPIKFNKFKKKKRFLFNRKKAPSKIFVPTRLHNKPHKVVLKPEIKINKDENFYESKNVLHGEEKTYHPDPLHKLRNLLNDPLVLSIECPGPDKKILLKKYGNVNVVNLNLDEKEISAIINYFSQQARIPVISGMLKAAVKGLMISAVGSEFVGSRFIINKIGRDNMMGI